MTSANETEASQSSWWVYMVRCSDGTFYTGITTDIERRVRQHNGQLHGGAKYTAARRPVELVYQQPCKHRSEASQEEYRLRRLSRQQKYTLCECH